MGKKSIVILYSEAKKEFFKTKEHYLTEKEVFPRAKVVKKHIEELGYKVILLPGNKKILKKLSGLKPYVIFNLVDSVGGREELAYLIPAALDFLSIPYTGAGVSGLLTNGNKFLTKVILKHMGIPVPDFQFFMDGKEPLDKSLHFPLIVKLNESHGSLEIDQTAVVENEKKLRERIKYLINKYHQSILVEEYIRGKEITVLMINNHQNNKIILSEERIFFKKEKYPMFSYEAAWGEKEIYDCKQYRLNEKLKKDTIKVFDILQFKDYGRFEIIIDKAGKHYFIDPNVNPSFGPYGTTSGPFGYLLHINNISFLSVVKIIINNAIIRHKYS